MIEAYQFEHRPLLYAILRRAELSYGVLFRKWFHPRATWWARVRALWIVLLGHETEICGLCGGEVEYVWWCQDDALWVKVTGYPKGGGISCVCCFDNLARDQRILLQWKPAVLD